MENGKRFGPFEGDFGVGTAGGSQDHLAILCCRSGHLTQARFLPAALEEEIPFPSDWSFVIAASGVVAQKGGAVQAHYNALAAQARAILEAWNSSHHESGESLLDILLSEEDAEPRLAGLLGDDPDAQMRRDRLHQFARETTELIPRAAEAIRHHDAKRLGEVIDRSHAMAVSVLANQVAETRQLAERARALGAIAASGFGAGFGGSVYAIVPTTTATDFRTAWEADYQNRFPATAGRAEFFQTQPADGARELD
jgi:galactokinase